MRLSCRGATAVEGIFGFCLVLLMVFTILQFTLICLGQSLALNNAYVNSRQKLVSNSSGSFSLFKAGVSSLFQKNSSSVRVPVIMPMVDGIIGRSVTLKASVGLGQNPKTEGDNKPGMQFGMENAMQNGNDFSSSNQK